MSRRAGLTLIEVIVVLTIVAVASVALWGVIGSVVKNWQDTSHRITREQDTRAAFSRMVHDIRGMQGPVQRAWLGEQTFTYMDENGDRVTLSWDGTPGTPLTRQVNNGPPQVLISQVQSLRFTYDIEE